MLFGDKLLSLPVIVLDSHKRVLKDRAQHNTIRATIKRVSKRDDTEQKHAV